ncbi:hypothetical protein MASR2M78_06900 [Treponema sp.]
MKSKLSLYLFSTLMLLGSLIALNAEESPDLSDDLFGSSDILVAEIISPSESSSLFETEKVTLGGSFSMTNESTGNPNELLRGEVGSLGTASDLSIKLFVDARPEEEYRVFVKGKLDYPIDGNGDAGATLTEAFADFKIIDTVFIRAGKQTTNWGVGYFFSPANLLDLSRIDPEDPTAERTGPLALKAQLPRATTNYYAYTILEDQGDRAQSGKDIILAPKAEWVFGSTELGLGGRWAQDRPWAVMTTVSSKMGYFDMIGELVLHGNEDKTFLISAPSLPLGLATETRSDELFPQVMIGLNWSWNDDLNRLGLSFHAEYFYNGMGYSDAYFIQDHYRELNPLVATGLLQAEDLKERGQHYGAANLGLLKILDSDFGLSFFWLSNLAERSGITKASLNYAGLKYVNISLSYAYTYGTEGSEYAPQGDVPSLSLKLSLSGFTF